MPKIDFGKIKDLDDFSPLPKGQYECRIFEVKEARTLAGEAMFKLTLAITRGEFKGRYIFDSLFFSKKGQRRLKHVCAALGLDVSGELDVSPEVLVGRRCRVDVELEEYEAVQRV